MWSTKDLQAIMEVWRQMKTEYKWLLLWNRKRVNKKFTKKFITHSRHET